MKPQRFYPWIPSTVNNWLAVDSDGYVCFVESFMPWGAPEWIRIPNHYLACVPNRLYAACADKNSDHRHMTVQDVANELGIFMLSTNPEKGCFSDKDQYCYDAIPEKPRRISEFPKSFAAIAYCVQLPSRKLSRQDTIAHSDWRQGDANEVNVAFCGNGIVLENATHESWMYKLPPDTGTEKKNLVKLSFLPNMCFEDDIVSQFPTFVDWMGYRPFFEEFIVWFSAHEAGCAFRPDSVDCFGLPKRMNAWSTGGKTAGYSFVLRDSDSFSIDHVGAVSLLLFSESSCYDAVMSRAKLLCSQYGLGIYEFKHNLVGKILETAERLTKHVVTAPEKRLNVVYSPSAQIRAGHVAFLRSL